MKRSPLASRQAASLVLVAGALATVVIVMRAPARPVTQDLDRPASLGVEQPEGGCLRHRFIHGFGRATTPEIAVANYIPDTRRASKQSGDRVAIFRVAEQGRVTAAYKVVKGPAGWFVTEVVRPGHCP